MKGPEKETIEKLMREAAEALPVSGETELQVVIIIEPLLKALLEALLKPLLKALLVAGMVMVVITIIVVMD